MRQNATPNHHFHKTILKNKVIFKILTKINFLNTILTGFQALVVTKSRDLVANDHPMDLSNGVQVMLDGLLPAALLLRLISVTKLVFYPVPEVRPPLRVLPGQLSQNCGMLLAFLWKNIVQFEM